MDVRVNPEAYSGVMTSRWFGSNMRRSVTWTKPIAKEILRDIMNPMCKIKPDNSLWSVDGRKKRVDLTAESWEKKRTRVVLQPEDIPKLIGLVSAQPLTRAFQ